MCDRVRDADKPGRSVSDHVREARQAIVQESSLPPAANVALVRARQLLSPPPSPFTPHHTSTWLSLFPPQVTLLTIALSPRPHPSSPSYMLVSKVATPSKPSIARGRGKKRAAKRGVSSNETTAPSSVQVEKVCGQQVEAALEELGVVLDEAAHCVTLQNRKEWWAARSRLNTRLQQCLEGLDDMCLEWDDVLSFPGPVLLVLGRHLHQLPWECVSALQDTVITRTPSLNFAAAHSMMVNVHEALSGTDMLS